MLTWKPISEGSTSSLRAISGAMATIELPAMTVTTCTSVVTASTASGRVLQ